MKGNIASLEHFCTFVCNSLLEKLHMDVILGCVQTFVYIYTGGSLCEGLYTFTSFI